MRAERSDKISREASVPNISTITIAVDLVHTPVKRKKDLDPDKVRAVAESILHRGLVEPVQVRPDGERFVLVDGLHRLEAAKALGETTIVAVLAAHRPEHPSMIAYERAAEIERDKIARLRKLRLEGEAGERNKVKIVPERSPPVGQTRYKKTDQSTKVRTLANWLKEQKETGGRY